MEALEDRYALPSCNGIDKDIVDDFNAISHRGVPSSIDRSDSNVPSTSRSACAVTSNLETCSLST